MSGQCLISNSRIVPSEQRGSRPKIAKEFQILFWERHLRVSRSHVSIALARANFL